MVEITDGEYRLNITNENIFIQHLQYDKVLNIEKETSDISECDSNIIQNIKKAINYKPHAILGIIQIEDIDFIIFVKSAYFIGKIEEAEIFRVKDTEIIPILPNSKAENISSDIKSQVVGIKNLFTLGFFYSFNYDLTNSIQKQAKMKGLDILSSANKKFFWNFCLYRKFYLGNQSKSNLSDNFNVDEKNNNGNEKFNKQKTRSSTELYNVHEVVNYGEINDTSDASNYFNNNNDYNRSPNNVSNRGNLGDFFNHNINNQNSPKFQNKFSNHTNSFTANIDYNNYNNANLINYEFNNLNISDNNLGNHFNKNIINNNINSGDIYLNNYQNHGNNSNNNILNPKVNKIWMVVCIYGYVGILSTMINSQKLAVYLISRRSIFHAGTRYLTRGIDDNGHVANFCETEQLVKFEHNLFSFMQFRGSVPIFFEQPGVTAQTQITRSPELTAPAFKKHIQEIKDDFNFIYMVNLMNVNKPNEHIITQNYENQIKINDVKNCKYLFWDFQNQCKYDNYENLDIFVINLESIFKIFKYYHENSNTGEKIKEQNGIIRTNCLDCLDRTNVIQARIAWKVLENQLNHLQIPNISDIFSGSFISAKTSKQHPLIEGFKDIWSENGDSISFQYAGTASCITSVTKNGKHGFLGFFQHGLVSITRFYQGNFEDGFKQKSIDILLQKNYKKKKNDTTNDQPFRHSIFASSDNSSISNSNENNLQNKFIINEASNPNKNYNISPNFSPVKTNVQKSNKFPGSDITVFIGSWNVAGKDFPENFSIIQWLFPKENMSLPDIYVLGFQEILNLNAKNIVISSNSPKVELWKKIILENLNNLGKYALVKTLDLVGLFLIIFVKENLCDYIKNIEVATLRTGLLGTLGNKGSCIIRMNFDSVSMAFCCSHLKAGSSNVSSRTTEISDILNKSFTMKTIKEMKFKDHDLQFIFGDLNFRVDLDLSSCLDFIKTGYLETLFLYDQLYKKKSLMPELMELEEMPIKFPPTYKYQIGNNDYDLKDKRVPSWCDRILFNFSKKINGIDYNHVEMFKESDHKPIYGLYKININDLKHSNNGTNQKVNVMSENMNLNQQHYQKGINLMSSHFNLQMNNHPLNNNLNKNILKDEFILNIANVQQNNIYSNNINIPNFFGENVKNTNEQVYMNPNVNQINSKTQNFFQNSNIQMQNNTGNIPNNNGNNLQNNNIYNPNLNPVNYQMSNNISNDFFNSMKVNNQINQNSYNQYYGNSMNQNNLNNVNLSNQNNMRLNEFNQNNYPVFNQGQNFNNKNNINFGNLGKN